MLTRGPLQAQVGHVAPEMMKTYSHIRRQALNQAADALEPIGAVPSAPPTPPAPATKPIARQRVMSHGTSLNVRRGGESSDLFAKLAPQVGLGLWTARRSRVVQ
jgi:hypothetical protein